MAKKLDEKQLEWTRANIDFLASFTPKITIRALLQNIDIIDDELKHYRAEIEWLRLLVDEKAQDERRMFENAERLQDNIVKLSAECRRLQAEVDEAREFKKVPLPRKVAEVIEWFRYQGMSNEEIYELSLDPSDGHYANTLNAWVDMGSGEGNALMIALVNGYTIEEEPADPLRDGIRKLVNEWEAADRSFDLSVSVSDYIRSLRAESKN